MLGHSALVFLRSSCVGDVFPSILQLFLRFIIVWVEFGLVFFFLHSVDSRNPKTNLEPEWTFHRGKGSSRKNNKSKNKRDLNGFKDPSFPLRLVKEKMCHLDVFGLNLDWWPYFVSPYAPPAQALLPQPACPPGVVVEPTTETKREPNEFNSWGHQLQQGHHQIVTCVFLLLLVARSISSLVC